MPAQQAVPAEVMQAVDRMCTPLDDSWLSSKSATAQEDARCMGVIRRHILRRENEEAGVKEYLTTEQKESQASVSYPACKGTNCGCIDGWSHSPECLAEHEAARGGGVKMSCKHGNHVDDCELCDVENELWRKYAKKRDEADELRAELDALRKQVPVGCMSRDQFDEMTGPTVENGEHFRIWQTDNPPNRAKAGVQLYAAPVMPQVPDGYRLQPLSEYDAMMSAPLDADNAELKAVWKWCRQTATDYGNGNARQRAAATAYLAAAHHIKSKYFRGCSDRSMIAASQKEDDGQ
jgi:hypothetical protein